MDIAGFTITSIEGSSVLHCHGELDLATRVDLAIHLTDLLVDDTTHVVVDLSEVSFIDCSSIGAFLALGRAIRPARRLTVVCPPGPVRKVLALTAFDRAHLVAPTLMDALDLPLTG